MKNLTWFEARDLALAGRAVRREAWRMWLTFGTALWFIDRADADTGEALHYVVHARTDEVPDGGFGSEEFLAGDWTDEAWDGGGEPPVAAWAEEGGAGSGGTGGSGSTGGSGGRPRFVPGSRPRSFGTAENPPDPTSIYQLAGGGGGGGSAVRPRAVPPHTPPVAQIPVVTVTFFTLPDDLPGVDPASHTYPAFDSMTDTPVTLRVEVSVAGGPAMLGLISVEIAGGTPQLGTAWPGYRRGFSFTGITAAPAASVTCTATYTVDGDDYTGTKVFTFRPAAGSSSST